MKLNLTLPHRNITEQQLIQDLKDAAKALGKETLSVNEYREYGKFNPSTITSRLGSWSHAITKAGIANNHTRNITREKLFDNLMKIWIVLGRRPYITDLLPPLSRYSKSPYKRMFGKWSTALEQFVEYAGNKNPIEGATLYTLPESLTSRNETGHHSTRRNINLRLRHKILQRDNYKCCACGNSPALNPGTVLHIDHIIPWSKGGETTPQNLQTLCSNCNLGKSNE